MIVLLLILADKAPLVPILQAQATFTLKVLATLLGLVVLGFCASQYGKERSLEEQYAFKSTLSLSLTPYKDVLEALIKSEATDTQIEFFVGGVQEIFSKPTYIEKRKRFFGNKSELDGAMEILKKMSDATAPILDKLPTKK